ncbi:MAG: helix-turn-helix domain-containing protein [Oscillospiraceae bacterium]|nr:helix-turn-helix domain-containing protein [Oscillospiraceae bacterium]
METKEQPANEPNGDLVEAFKTMIKNADAFSQFLDMIPYGIEIFAPDGTLVFANRAECEEMNVADPGEAIGHYNILRDPVVLDVLGQRENIERAFKEGTVSTSDIIRIPYEDLTARYSRKDEDFRNVKFQTVTIFPLKDEAQGITYTAMIFFTVNTYKGKTEITKAQEYMNKNWLEEYDADRIAQEVNLSPYHFSRLFKQHTNETPFDYYKRIKIKKLKEKLCDLNLSIAEAFAACGINYKGRYVQFFKETVGMSPSKYREEIFRTK